jgi:two-component system NtrC family sensor kinase
LRDEIARLERSHALEVEETYEFLESLLDVVPAALVAMAPDGSVTHVNEKAERVLGKKPGELIGRACQELGVPCRPEQCSRVTSEGVPSMTWEIDVVNERGLPRTLLWSCETQGSGGDKPRRCVASLIDVTDRRELQGKVFQAKQEIEAVFDSITDPTFVLGEDHRIMRANQAFAHFVKKPYQDILGQSCRDILQHKPARCDHCPAAEVFRTGKAQDVDFRDQQGAIYKVHSFPIFKRGRPENVVVRYQDVTAEKEMEHQLLHSDKMASIGQLAAGIAHEINSPVGFILSNLDLLAGETGELGEFFAGMRSIGHSVGTGARDPLAGWEELRALEKKAELEVILTELSEMVEECQEGAQSIRKIVSDLKTFSHPGTEEPVPADINGCLESTLNMVWNELKYHCQVAKNFRELPPVLCVPQQLNQVFVNLLVNAAQAIPEQGTVTVSTKVDDGRVFVSITDDGVGIPRERIKRIFDPFFTTKEPGKGTGLGLHLSMNMVRNHGGNIRVESEPGQGSTFTVILPVAPPESSPLGDRAGSSGRFSPEPLE